MSASGFRREVAAARRWLFGEWLATRAFRASDLGGLVWYDINRNGLLDAGEPGLAATLVELVATTDTVIGNSDDRILAAAATDSAGNYSFASAAEAQYYRRFLRQPVGGMGHRFTAA